MAKLTRSKIVEIKNEAAREKYDKLITIAKQELSAYVRFEIIEKALIADWEKFKKYIMVTSYFTLTTSTHGRIDFDCEHYPNSWRASVYILESEVPLELIKKLTSLLDAKQKFKEEIESVLSSLKTDTKVIELIPEFAKYFNRNSCVSLMLSQESINDFRSKLQK